MKLSSKAVAPGSPRVLTGAVACGRGPESTVGLWLRSGLPCFSCPGQGWWHPALVLPTGVSGQVPRGPAVPRRPASLSLLTSPGPALQR